MNASVIRTKEMRFIYNFIISLRNGESIARKEFKQYYDMLNKVIDEEHTKYVFTPIVLCYIQEIRDGGTYNKAILTQLINTIESINVNFGRVNLDLFSDIVDLTVSNRNDVSQKNALTISEMIIEKLKNIDTYLEEDVNFSIEREAVKLVQDLLYTYPTLDPKNGLYIMEQAQRIEHRYFKDYYYMANRGTRI